MTKARDLSAFVSQGVSTTELGYLDGVTSAVQTQLNQKPEFTAGKNAIINGGMDFWQRGTSFTNVTIANYTADRYNINRGGDVAGLSISRSTDVPTGFTYSMKWQRASGNTLTDTTTMYYGLESADSTRFIGKTATLSLYAKAGANYSGAGLSMAIGSGTGTDAKPYQYTTTVANSVVSLSTSWTRYTLTGTFSASATQAFFATSWAPSGTAGADDSVYITGIQLEVGSTATPFSRAGGSLGGELALCQRYYNKSYPQGTYAGTSLAYTGMYHWTTASSVSGANNFTIQYPVTMRSAPVVTIYAPGTGASGKMRSPSAGTDWTANTYDIGDFGCLAQIDQAVTAGYVVQFHYTANAEL